MNPRSRPHPKEFPSSRDVSVTPASPRVDKNEGKVLAESISAPCAVTVMGFDRNDVLFRSDKANIVQWRDSAGVIVAILVRLKPDVWGFSKRGDDDWEEVLSLYGNPDPGKDGQTH